MSAGAKNAALLVFAITVSLLALEALLRVIPSTVLGFTYRNGFFRLPVESDLHSDFKVVKGPDPAPKVPGRRRILLLGDSFVQGVAVPPEQRVGVRLERHLKALGADADVVTLAGAGLGPRAELDLLKRYGAEFEPDLVVTVFYTGNDVADSLSKADETSLIATGRYLTTWGAQISNFERDDAHWLFIESSRLNQLISHRITTAARRRDVRGVPLPWLVYEPVQDERWARAWMATRRTLMETKSRSAALGAGYAIVSVAAVFAVKGDPGLTEVAQNYPDVLSREWDFELPDRILRNFTTRAGIPFLALLPIFHDEFAKNGTSLHFQYDLHWNATGHDRAAAHIAEFVLDVLPTR